MASGPTFTPSTRFLRAAELEQLRRDRVARDWGWVVSRLYSDIFTSRKGDDSGDLTRLKPKFLCEKVDFWYGPKQALFDVNVTILEKSVLALIGPSGCGKSTFIRLLNRMNDLIDGTRTQGKITLDGKEVYAPDVNLPDLRRRGGVTFQKENPLQNKAYENVAYGTRVAGARDRAQQQTTTGPHRLQTT